MNRRRDKVYSFYQKIHKNPTVEKSNYRAKKVAKIFSEYKFGNILDIGCSDCGFSAILKKVSNANEVYGVDISEDAVKCGLKKGIKVFQVDIDSEKLPFEDNFFDAIYCGELIEHLFDPDRLLDEICRVSKSGALVVITTPNLACWFNRISLLLGYQPYYTEVSPRYSVGKFLYSRDEFGGHIRIFTHRAFLQLMKMHSFDIVKVTGARANLPFPFSILDAFISRFPCLSSTCIMIARCKKE